MVTWTTLGNGDKQAYLTPADGASLVLPSDWNPSANKIECIGAGSGAGSNGNLNGPGAGYGAEVNYPGQPGATVQFSVGTGGVGGSARTAGGDTWWGASAYASAFAGARGGPASSAATPTDNIGSVKFAGGRAANGTVGGGGAAGPNGAGGNASGTKSGSADGNTTPGVAGVTSGAGTPGTAGIEYDSAHGSGTGGGSTSASGQKGGDGGRYGGGGGYGAAGGGKGQDGLIRATYTPTSAATPAVCQLTVIG